MMTYPNIGLGNAPWASGCIATTHWSVKLLELRCFTKILCVLLSTTILRLKYKFFDPLSKLMTKETKPWFRFNRILLFNQDRFRLVHRRFFFKLLSCRYLDNRYFYSIRTIILLWRKSMAKNLLVCIRLSLIAKPREKIGWRWGLWLGYASPSSTAMYCPCLPNHPMQALWFLHSITD